LSVVTLSLPAAVFWDMDGTLVDTEPYWMSAETALVESYGGTWTHEEALGLVGQGLEYSAQMLQAKGVELEEEELILGLTTRVLEQVKREVPWQPGARELLTALHEAGIPTALVTMSRGLLADYVAERTGNLFDAVVSGDDVENSKPDPEPYLRAATLLGVSVEECIAIEDSRPGVASAVAAGAITIGVPHVAPLDPSPSYTLWDSLAGKTIADLAALLPGRAA
jgi:HAD superfamily hydrolase (TIGR01509 family)